MQGMRYGLDAFSSSSFVMGGGSPQLSVRRGQNGMEYVERFNKPVSEGTLVCLPVPGVEFGATLLLHVC